MTVPRARCLFEAVNTAVQTYYLTGHVTAALWQTQKNILQDSTEQKLAQHRNDTDPNNSHAVAASKRMQATAGVGAKVSK